MSRIHLISGPRNISTALMYSFGNRPDMSIVDEPFYAYYLHKHPEIDHPGREETLKELPASFDEVIASLIDADYPSPHVFFKNMAHHLDATDLSFTLPLKNVFLIREPKQLIASFAQVIPNPTLLDIGLKLEWEIFSYLKERNGNYVVLNSNEVLKNPKAVLSKLCEQLDLPFAEEMLAWPAGPRPEDGSWAKYWYANVHQSTGFQKQMTSSRPFPERLQPLLNEAQKYYDSLVEYSIKA